MTTTDDTQAAEPVLDATEPAPAEDATQGIYAWSEHADDDTVLIQRRSWKIPVALTVLATAAAVTTGVVMLWPAQKTSLPAKTPSVVAAPPPAPSAAPAPEGLAITPSDKQFLDSITAYGFRKFDTVNDPQRVSNAIAVGRASCELLKMGNSLPDTVDQISQKMPWASGQQVTVFVNDAVTAYCPQYAN